MKIAAQFAALLAISILAACGGDDGGDAPDARITTPDADTTPSPDAEPNVTCTVAASLGAATAAGQVAYGDPVAAPTVAIVSGAVNADALADLVQLELYAGAGAVPAGALAPATYQITGAELNYATCGVCVRLFADVDPATGESPAQYLATAGTVTITQVTPNLQATLSNITFETVTVAPAPDYTSTPVGDGCVSAITSAAFDATVTEFPQ